MVGPHGVRRRGVGCRGVREFILGLGRRFGREQSGGERRPFRLSGVQQDAGYQADWWHDGADQRPGLTLYWFVPDSPHKSACYGDCAQHWDPVPGPAIAGGGVTGTLGTITRSGGSKQATYDGHPLYTYVADTTPGQTKGNGLNISGGVWHEMTASGATPAPAQSSAPAGGGGYGY
jgi:predicted lipoprotein with Yx(FWY)xxD motif